MTLTSQQVDEIVAQTTRSGAQKAAVTKALTLASDILIGGSAPDVVLKPQTAAAVFVASGRSPLGKRTEGGVEHRAESQQCWASLQAAIERVGGPIEIITFGGFGCELTAKKFAAATGMTHREFAVVWNVAQPEGTTVRDQYAVRTRDAKLKAYVAQVEKPIAVLYAAGSSDGRNAKAVFNTLVRLGAYHRGKPLAAEDPGALAAGQPDVPVAS